jgi:hypothetical protein
MTIVVLPLRKVVMSQLLNMNVNNLVLPDVFSVHLCWVWDIWVHSIIMIVRCVALVVNCSVVTFAPVCIIWTALHPLLRYSLQLL